MAPNQSKGKHPRMPASATSGQATPRSPAAVGGQLNDAEDRSAIVRERFAFIIGVMVREILIQPVAANFAVPIEEVQGEVVQNAVEAPEVVEDTVDRVPQRTVVKRELPKTEDDKLYQKTKKIKKVFRQIGSSRRVETHWSDRTLGWDQQRRYILLGTNSFTSAELLRRPAVDISSDWISRSEIERLSEIGIGPMTEIEVMVEMMVKLALEEDDSTIGDDDSIESIDDDDDEADIPHRSPFSPPPFAPSPSPFSPPPFPPSPTPPFCPFPSPLRPSPPSSPSLSSYSSSDSSDSDSDSDDDDNANANVIPNPYVPGFNMHPQHFPNNILNWLPVVLDQDEVDSCNIGRYLGGDALFVGLMKVATEASRNGARVAVLHPHVALDALRLAREDEDERERRLLQGIRGQAPLLELPSQTLLENVVYGAGWTDCLIPMLVNNNHWIVAVVRRSSVSATIYDSLGQPTNERLSILAVKKILEALERLNADDKTTSRFRVRYNRPGCRDVQRDGDSCGLYAVCHARRALGRKECSAAQKNDAPICVPQERLDIQDELVGLIALFRRLAVLGRQWRNGQAGQLRCFPGNVLVTLNYR